MISEEQRQRRKQGLFSSDVARLMTGQEVLVSLEKLGKTEEIDFGDVMEINIGWKAESLVLDAYQQQMSVPDLHRNIDTRIHPEYPWLGCHQDAEHTDVNVEAKTVGYYNRPLWGDGGDQIPDYVLWQAIEQMAVSGASVTHIPVCFVSALSLKYLFLDQPPPITIFEVRRDFELETYMLQKAKHVWDCVQQGITPIPRTLEDVKLLYPFGNPGIPIEATEEVELLWSELVKWRNKRKEAEEKEDEHKRLIQIYMNTASVLQKDGKVLATWRNDSDSEIFDKKKFELEHPALFSQYSKNKTGVRKFLVKAPKEK